jgi:hypothetical protein
MRFCPDCGNEHECTAGGNGADREVEIERLRTKRDIEVAQIQARAQRRELETDEAVAQIEGEAGVATAEATAEVLGEVLAASGETPADPAPPVIMDPPAPDPEPGPDVPPPPPADAVPPPAREKKKPGWWDGYH